MSRTQQTGLSLGILALLLALAPLTATDSRAEPQLYDIELLIFENLVKNDGGEVWARHYPDWFDAGEAETAGAAKQDVVWLTRPQYRLGAHYNALRRSAQYRPLAHLAWRQEVSDRERADALPLPPSPAPAGQNYVDGSVRVAVERYLHLYLDLQLHTPMPRAPEAAAELGAEGAPEVRLREHRRMRSKELHYFDNPRFGVLALITPHEPEPATAEAAPSGSQGGGSGPE